MPLSSAYDGHVDLGQGAVFQARLNVSPDQNASTKEFW
jgi:hypothetical protein